MHQIERFFACTAARFFKNYFLVHNTPPPSPIIIGLFDLKLHIHFVFLAVFLKAYCTELRVYKLTNIVAKNYNTFDQGCCSIKEEETFTLPISQICTASK
jgi:hypothetical protein